MLTVILESAVYLCVGLIIMMIGHWIIDLIIPVDFPQEINDGNKALKEKNEAAGIMVFGIFVGIAFIVSGVIQ